MESLKLDLYTIGINFGNNLLQCLITHHFFCNNMLTFMRIALYRERESSAPRGWESHTPVPSCIKAAFSTEHTQDTLSCQFSPLPRIALGSIESFYLQVLKSERNKRVYLRRG